MIIGGGVSYHISWILHIEDGLCNEWKKDNAKMGVTFLGQGAPIYVITLTVV
jgi:hypothetical protein